jgi:hypothetical protein
MLRFLVAGSGGALRIHLAVALLITQVIGVLAVEHAYGQQPGADPRAKLCRAITDDAMRLRCFENSTRRQVTESVSRPLGIKAGTWRLVRTPNPAGGPDAVSIMQTADTAKSDLDLAGLALRCQDGGFGVLVVLVGAVSPRAHPKVVISTGGTAVDFVATIIPPGLSLLLPPAASALASGPWSTAAELTIGIEIEQTDGPPKMIRGVVPVAGLREAIAPLLRNCPAQ